MTTESNCTPQVKICGLKKTDQAVKCADLGADAVGLIFYPGSPRFVPDRQAGEICGALGNSVSKIGVFVDEPFDGIMQKVGRCDLTGVQLHGVETPELVERLRNEGLIVIKGLFARKSPRLEDAGLFNASAYLVECGKGKLPGGNAMEWNWSEALAIGENRPFVLAGGLRPENVAKAVSECLPDAVDVSSGVETSPGDKDLDKVDRFIKTTRGLFELYRSNRKKPEKIFRSPSF